MKISRLIPMLPVKHMPTSISFYEKLGFTVEDQRNEWGWALLACGGCRLLVDQSINTEPSAARQSVIYLYPDDIVAYHQQVRDMGVEVPELDTTFYGMREFRLDDPDGNRLWIGQPLGKNHG